MLRQTDPASIVLVAGHERPDIPEMNHPLVVFLQAHWCLKEPMRDKRLKLELIACHWRWVGGGFLMPVDADDVLSSRIVDHVRSKPARRGFYIAKGYELNDASGRLAPSPRFHKACGSCNIIIWTLEELPAYLDQRGLLFHRMLDGGHAKVVELFASIGEPLAPLPFKAACYVRHADQISRQTRTDGWRRRLLRLVIPSSAPTVAERIEFGL
jgi:hypothetical protein